MTENKTKRLYFDCPIQAAYMTKEFGVTIHGIATKSGHKYPISSDWEEVINFRCGKLYVDEQSEHIFDPKEGDSDGYYLTWEEDEGGWYNREYGKPNDYEKPEIMVRDGKHFFAAKEKN